MITDMHAQTLSMEKAFTENLAAAKLTVQNAENELGK